MTWLLTHSGKQFDLIDPQPDMIDLMDIAHGLAHECRFAGQCRSFYSVAQHSVMVSEIIDDEYALEGLLHDASEAYLKDIPRPLKLLLPDYRAIEQRTESAIRAAFGLPQKQSDQVKLADRIMLATERRDLMPPEDEAWPSLHCITPLEKRLIPVNYHRARAMFHKRILEVTLK